MPKHVLRFYSGDGKPTIIYRQDSGVDSIALAGEQDIVFSDKVACIGFRTPYGYCRCKNSAIHTRQCPTCSALDISRAYTVGDFSGYPALYEEAKKQEYVLYLAGFGEDIVKCGVTRKERFEERMREQGADFGAIVATYQGPDEIYNAEAMLQSRFQFQNSVRLAQKMRRLEFDHGKARENFDAGLELVKSAGVFASGARVQDFSSSYPRVKKVQATYSVLGEILGAKGEILLFRSESGKHFAVNMRKTVGTFF